MFVELAAYNNSKKNHFMPSGHCLQAGSSPDWWEEVKGCWCSTGAGMRQAKSALFTEDEYINYTFAAFRKCISKLHCRLYENLPAPRTREYVLLRRNV